MRLQLSLAAALAMLLGAATPAAAQAGRASLRFYTDDDHVTVWSPAADVDTSLGRDLTLSVESTADVVSAASVDVTSQASPRAFEEVRVEGGLSLRWAATRTRSLRLGAIGSTENDFRSLHLQLGGRVELAGRNTTLDAACTLAFDQVGRVDDPAVAHSRDGQRLALTLTQILDPRTYLDVVLDGEVQWGYLASPYRYVPVVDDAGAMLYQLPESVPERRGSGAALLRVRRALAPRWFSHADYRLYADSWGVRSHTASVTGVFATPGDRLVIGVTGRGYLQGAASFYRASYLDPGTGAPGWRTRDRTLGGMRTFSLALAADLALGGDRAPRLVVALTAVRFVWLDYSLQAGRDALIATLGVTVPF